MLDKVQEEKSKQKVIELCNSYPNELSDLAKTAVKDLRDLGASWEYLELALSTKSEKDWATYGFGLLFNTSYKGQILRALYKKHNSQEVEQELTKQVQEHVEQKALETEKQQVDTTKKRSTILDPELQTELNYPLDKAVSDVDKELLRLDPYSSYNDYLFKDSKPYIKHYLTHDVGMPESPNTGDTIDGAVQYVFSLTEEEIDCTKPYIEEACDYLLAEYDYLRNYVYDDCSDRIINRHSPEYKEFLLRLPKLMRVKNKCR